MRVRKTSIRFLALSILLICSSITTPDVAATPSKSNHFDKEVNSQQRLVEQEATHKQAAQNEAKQKEKVIQNLHEYTHLPLNTVRFIVEESEEKNVPSSIVFGLMEQESTFRIDAVNPTSGATGLGQIEHTTALRLAAHFGKGDLNDPIYNSRLAIFYLQYLHHETEDWNATLTAYNRGLGGLTSYKRKYRTVVSDYSRSVLNRSQNIKQVTGAV